MIRRLEEVSLNAWPALQTVVYDGWLLRFADGYTRRANSVYALYPSTTDTLEKVAYCEQVYQSRGQDCVFKMSAAVQPSNLDAMLEEQGYGADAATSVQTLNLKGVGLPDAETVRLDTEVTEEWLAAFCRLNDVDARRLPTMTRMLNSIVPAKCFASLQRNGETVAVGLAVAEGGYVGLFDIVTAAHARNQGLGTQLVLHLLNWGKSNGASHAYLQVMQNNAPALSLYAKLGYREQYRYWYRVKKLQP
ncbi:MAG TPA: GNAT family N-acetyltransferase [Ardenticatenaceae bacterium]